jgi:hypothetical protein
MIGQAPIARVTVAGYKAVGVSLYAPGLPDGEHDVYINSGEDEIARLTAEKERWLVLLLLCEEYLRDEPHPSEGGSWTAFNLMRAIRDELAKEQAP